MSAIKWLVFAIISTLCLVLVSFQKQSNLLIADYTLEVENQYAKGLNELNEAIDKLHDSALKVKGGAESEILREAITNARYAYKSIEFLIEYFDPQAVKNSLNGAPLPSVMPKVPEVIVLEPEGLQVLDEIIFLEEPSEAIDDIIPLCEQLKNVYTPIKNYQLKKDITHRHIFEAVRFELIRVFTLGLTGFDTPGSANAIPEASKALSASSKAIFVHDELLAKKKPALKDEIHSLFKEAQKYLEENNDFETFDRLVFLKSFINPLYEKVYKAQRTIGIETIDEVERVPHHVNYHSTNIFGNDFFNAGAFANIPEKDLSSEKVALGRMLFFDPILSVNNKRACASCHDPEKAFTDGNKKSLALDFEGTVNRNAPTVINSVFADKWFYDFRVEILDMQMQHVVADKKEFATNFSEIIKKIKESKEYVELFNEVYGMQSSRSISGGAITDALNCYVASLHSFNSPFDQYVRGESEELSESAKRGFTIFMGKAACGTCHFAPSFYGTVPPYFKESESEVLGVPGTKDTVNPVLDSDIGRYGNGYQIDKADFYKYSFKTTTVRNVAMTAPYMHNGVYDSLEEVVNFYNMGGGAGMGMELEHQTLPFSELNLS